MGNLTGKVALITGAGTKTGMGRAISLRLARDGADIVVTDIARPKGDQKQKDPEDSWGLENLIEEGKAMGRSAFAITGDLRDRKEIENMVEEATGKFGFIDILVNNAALTGSTIGRIPVMSFPEDVWDKQLDINLTAPFLICKLVAKKMAARGMGGKIVNMASSVAKRAQAGVSGYSASKFGLIGLTQTLALELAQYRINVNAVCPGIILSWGGRGPKLRKAISEGATLEEAVKQVYADLLPSVPWGRLGTPDEVANLVSFLVSNDSDYITGQSINVDGGYLMH